MKELYKRFIDLVKVNELEISVREGTDPQSGWYEKVYEVYDGDYMITYLGNGMGFSDSDVEKAIRKIKEYLAEKNMNTIEDLEIWLETHRRNPKK